MTKKREKIAFRTVKGNEERKRRSHDRVSSPFYFLFHRYQIPHQKMEKQSENNVTISFRTLRGKVSKGKGPAMIIFPLFPFLSIQTLMRKMAKIRKKFASISFRTLTGNEVRKRRKRDREHFTYSFLSQNQLKKTHRRKGE